MTGPKDIFSCTPTLAHLDKCRAIDRASLRTDAVVLQNVLLLQKPPQYLQIQVVETRASSCVQHLAEAIHFPLFIVNSVSTFHLQLEGCHRAAR